ncbi:DUF6332 family protein [Streptomyces sp. NBC_01317]|uniref:DUF6332 family protein n=1 Tax=Streptomyces sp. NBC_01317 TaxID=2903822 RepID=UPI002E0DEACB|nr:DUF6332 family protein [Streptomyces sp. NBC_01317]
MGTRSRAQRDAATVEIGYALVSAGFVACLVYCGLYGPVWFFDLPRGLARVARVAAGITFVVRVVHVLWRFPRDPALGDRTPYDPTPYDSAPSRPAPHDPAPGEDPPYGDQPSQPGRTSPDS